MDAEKDDCMQNSYAVFLYHFRYRVGNFRQKNNSAEDGIDGINKWLFPTEFQLFCGTENLGIPFRTLPRKRKQLGIPFRGPKIEINSHNSVPNHSAEEITTQNSVP
jgi:hypothetical protein